MAFQQPARGNMLAILVPARRRLVDAHPAMIPQRPTLAPICTARASLLLGQSARHHGQRASRRRVLVHGGSADSLSAHRALAENPWAILLQVLVQPIQGQCEAATHHWAHDGPKGALLGLMHQQLPAQELPALVRVVAGDRKVLATCFMMTSVTPSELRRTTFEAASTRKIRDHASDRHVGEHLGAAEVALADRARVDHVPVRKQTPSAEEVVATGRLHGLLADLEADRASELLRQVHAIVHGRRGGGSDCCCGGASAAGARYGCTCAREGAGIAGGRHWGTCCGRC
mmetsp:Transcript_9052/g.25225  ORF Transcript_9052/g.25225 Transcript_9052/m.25225 type:complete len:287 (-) Transcript_9052:41-901(-)